MNAMFRTVAPEGVSLLPHIYVLGVQEHDPPRPAPLEPWKTAVHGNPLMQVTDRVSTSLFRQNSRLFNTIYTQIQYHFLQLISELSKKNISKHVTYRHRCFNSVACEICSILKTKKAIVWYVA